MLFDFHLKMEEIKMDSSSDPPEIKNKEDEDTVRWKFEEVEKYILEKIGTLMEDPVNNPLFAMWKNISAASDEMQQLCDKYAKLQKSIDQMNREQLLFHTRRGVEPKIKTKDVAVGVDLPPLPESERFSYSFNSVGKSKVTPIAKSIVKKPSGPVECIELSSDEETPTPSSTNNTEKERVTTTNSTISTTVQNPPTHSTLNQTKHPAPLPSSHLLGQNAANTPPKPVLKISVAKNGIVLQWDMPPEAKNMNIANFEIYGYQEKSNVSASSSQWERIGFVQAMPLPMSCTLTQFVQGCKYHFSIRAVTSSNKLGHFSDPASIMFVTDPKKKN